MGSQQVLLTEAESRCFYIARDYQRKFLLRSLVPEELQQWRMGYNKLGWSKNPFVLAAQWMVLVLAVVPMCVWLVLKCCSRLLVFPIRYLRTFTVPKNLKAPGEKTLVGIHNAFSGHLNLGAGDYIACINDWIKVLYGEEISAHYNLENIMNVELGRHRQFSGHALSTAMRPLVAVSREKLSKQLGHYGRVERLH